jgi:Leucine-rich repeat (LRR) protein
VAGRLLGVTGFLLYFMGVNKQTAISVEEAARMLGMEYGRLYELLRMEFDRNFLEGEDETSGWGIYLERTLSGIAKWAGDEHWLHTTRRLLELPTGRWFYFEENELEAVRRIFHANDYRSDTLDLSDLLLVSVPSVVSMLKLKDLNVSLNRLTDLSFLDESFSGLENLRANYNQLTDVTPLAGMKQLAYLELSENLIDNFLPLAGLQNLKCLRASGNIVKDRKQLMVLSHMPQLEVLDLSRNRLPFSDFVLGNLHEIRKALTVPGSQGHRASSSGSRSPEPELEEPFLESIPAEEEPAPQTTSGPAKVEPPPQASLRSFPTGKVWISGSPEENLLHVEEVSKILYESIANTEEEVEQFFGLFGRWGRGKTHLWNFLRKKFIDTQKGAAGERYIAVDFHAWKYQETPGLWAFVYLELRKAYFKEASGMWGRFVKWLKLHWGRGKLPKALAFAGVGIGVIVLVHFLFGQKLDSVVKDITVTAGVLASSLPLIKFLYDNYQNNAKQLFSEMSSSSSFESHLGLQHEIQEELKYLLETWLPHKKKDLSKPNKRIFLFIDDIDRCSEDKIIQIVDYIRVLLHDAEVQSRITVLAAIDERILVHAIQNKYRKFIDNPDNDASYKELCREYMDKLFLAGIKLGPLTGFEKTEVVKGFTRKYVKKIVLKEDGKSGITSSVEKADKALSSDEVNSNLRSSSSGSVKSIRVAEVSGVSALRAANYTAENLMAAAELYNSLTGQEQDYSLETWEQEFIQDIISKHTELTPRGIRVYTHRYLLGKKLIEKPLTQGKASWEQWYHLPEAKHCFALKLLHYSFVAGVPELYNDYNSYIKHYDENNIIKESIYGHEFNINQELGSIMYQSLMMIVAY